MNENPKITIVLELSPEMWEVAKDFDLVDAVRRAALKKMLEIILLRLQ